MKIKLKPKIKLLFICSANIDRSPTAEALFKNSDKYEAKSAGTLDMAINHVNQDLITWADIIFAINERDDKHLTYLKDEYNVAGKKIYDLDIPNIYKRGDPLLINLLKEKIAEFIEI